MNEILHTAQLTVDHIANSTVDPSAVTSVDRHGAVFSVDEHAAWTWDHTPRGGWSVEQLRRRDDGHYGVDPAVPGVIELGHVGPQRVLDEITSMIYAYETRFQA